MANLRICISGPSGVGKSTLATEISKAYNIPFITTSTKPLWDKYKIRSHQELIERTLVDPQWGIDFQDEVLDYRINKLLGVKDFVTDRSPLDNLAYFLMQNSYNTSEEKTAKYIQRCKDAMALFTGIIVIPFTDEVVLENDGKRVNNRYYQEYTNAVFVLAAKIMRQEFGKMYGETLMMWNFEARVAHTANLLNKILKHEEDNSIGNR